jgi:hypothetical protein
MKVIFYDLNSMDQGDVISAAEFLGGTYEYLNPGLSLEAAVACGRSMSLVVPDQPDQGEEDAHECECGDIMGEACCWSGPISETVTVEWMPEQYRASHEAAGNAGSYPYNGAIRLRLARSCYERLKEYEGKWMSEVK